MRPLMPPVQTPDNLFHDGNPLTGELGTIVDAELLNNEQAAIRDTQSELIAILTAAAMEPASTAGQLLAALNKLYAPFNDTLGALSTLVGGANKLPYFTAADAAALTALSSIGLDIIGKATVADVLTYLGLDIALAGKQDKTSQLSIFATGSDVQILKLLGLDTALADKQPKDTTLTNLSGKNIAQLLDYLGLAAAGNTSGNLALIGDTKNQADKCAVIVKTGSNANGKYRIWSDGSIDMWGNGIANMNGDALVNYPIALPAAAQNVTTTPLVLSTEANRPITSVMVVTDLTTATKATFIVKRSDGTTSADGFYWSVNYAVF